MISLTAYHLHHHLMHLLGFYELTHCITTWCISWDFMNSLTASPLASPPDASPRILWSHSLHHHLHHTWCISWDFMISLTTSPLDASLGIL
jgi:hypothetical protein